MVVNTENLNDVRVVIASISGHFHCRRSCGLQTNTRAAKGSLSMLHRLFPGEMPVLCFSNYDIRGMNFCLSLKYGVRVIA